MKIGVLFSGGKDSTYAAYLAKKQGNEIACLITLESENKDSFMFHTPSISKTRKQAEAMGIPLILRKTKGKKEEELADLEKAIETAVQKYEIGGIVTGALASVYQASRIQTICDKLKLRCVNPLWGKDQIELLRELVKNRFEVIIIGVAAEGIGREWLGRKIDSSFILDMEKIQKKLGVNPAGEGGEFESFVLNCPLFEKKLEVKSRQIEGSGNSWRMEITVE